MGIKKKITENPSKHQNKAIDPVFKNNLLPGSKTETFFYLVRHVLTEVRVNCIYRASNPSSSPAKEQARNSQARRKKRMD